jgi:hypothetical protein
MPLSPENLTVEDLQKLAQAEKQRGDRAKANLMQLRKSAQELSKAAQTVAEISKKNPEV